MHKTLSIALILIAAQGYGQKLTISSAFSQASSNRQSILASKHNLDNAMLSAKAFGTYPTSSLDLGYSNDPKIAGVNNDLLLNVPIDAFGRRRSGALTGSALVSQAESSYLTTIQSVQDEVLRAFFESSAASRQLAVATGLLEIAKELDRTTERRFTEGKIPEVQRTRAKIELDRADQNAKVAKAAYASSLIKLAGALGSSDPIEGIEDALEISIDPTVTGIDNRGDIRQLSADVQMAKADADSTKSSNKPELAFQAGRVGWQDNPSSMGARLQLSIPILDSGRARNLSAAADKKVKTAEATLADSRRKAEAEVRAVKVDLESKREQVRSYQNLVTITTTLVEKAKLGFREGATSLVEILDATRTLREVEEGLIDAQLSYALSLADFVRSTGTVLSGGSK